MVYDGVYQLANQIKDSDEYKQYVAARDEVLANESNAVLFKEYQKLSIEAQTYLMGGQNIPSELEDKLNKLYAVLQLNAEVMNFMALEYQFSTALTEVYRILNKELDLDKGMPDTPQDEGDAKIELEH